MQEFPVHGPWCGGRIDKIACKYCGQPVYLYTCNHGSCVVFEQSEPPWPKHYCDEHMLVNLLNAHLGEDPDHLRKVHLARDAARLTGSSTWMEDFAKDYIGPQLRQVIPRLYGDSRETQDEFYETTVYPTELEECEICGQITFVEHVGTLEEYYRQTVWLVGAFKDEFPLAHENFYYVECVDKTVEEVSEDGKPIAYCYMFLTPRSNGPLAPGQIIIATLRSLNIVGHPTEWVGDIVLKSTPRNYLFEYILNYL